MAKKKKNNSKPSGRGGFKVPKGYLGPTEIGRRLGIHRTSVYRVISRALDNNVPITIYKHPNYKKGWMLKEEDIPKLMFITNREVSFDESLLIVIKRLDYALERLKEIDVEEANSIENEIYGHVQILLKGIGYKGEKDGDKN